MKTRHIILILVIALCAAAAGWFAAKRWGGASTASGAGNARKVLYYQSSMHPWIKSDQPGKCTICGMDLVPVYEGESGFESEAGVVTLGTNSIQVLHVRSAPVTRQPLTREFRFAGTIDDSAARRRILSAYVNGRVDELFVNYVGAEVNVGEPLALMYSPMLLAAEREYATLVNQSREGAEQARLVAAARLRLKQLGLTDAQIDAVPGKPAERIHSEMLAPMDGTVTERNVYAGQYVAEGERLFELADLSTMWLLFDAYEQDLPWLKVGQTVEVTTPAAPDRVFSAAITFIDPTLNPITRATKVRVEIPNPLVETNGITRRALPNRAYAEALVKVKSAPTLVVPRSAVLMPQSHRPVVYVDRGGGAYEQRVVRLGRVSDEFREVLGGVSEGENVVVQGNLLIDAQAQLNASANQPAAGHDHGHAEAATEKPAAPAPAPDSALNEAQRAAAQQFLAFMDALAASLAADDLAQFNAQTGQAHDALAALRSAFPTDSKWNPFIEKIESHGHLAKADDLKAARQQFHPLSQAAVEFARALRPQDSSFASLKVYRCPMTRDAFKNAPRTADWIQLQPGVRNPYFGAEMLDCGVEVKP